MATAIFFASSTGNSEEIANKISQNLDNIEVFNISNGVEEINNFDKLIIGGSTWGEGELNDDWDDAWDDFKELDFSGKTVALFGLGDQEGYADEFCDVLGIFYEHLNSTGAKIIGSTSTDGYEFDESRAVVDDKFVGLVLDEDNQSDLSDERIESWCAQIKADIL